MAITSSKAYVFCTYYGHHLLVSKIRAATYARHVCVSEKNNIPFPISQVTQGKAHEPDGGAASSGDAFDEQAEMREINDRLAKQRPLDLANLAAFMWLLFKGDTFKTDCMLYQSVYIYIISYVSVYLCLQYYTVYASESVSISESRSSPVSISMYLVLAILFRSYRGLTRSFTLSQQHVWPHP